MFSRTLLCAALAVALSPTATAQQGNIRSVVLYKIKGGETGNYIAAVKDLNVLYKKAGVTRYTSRWLSQSGQREYALVRNYQSFAELDQLPANDPKLKDHVVAYNAILTRINQTVESARRIIEVVDADLSLPMNNDLPPAIVRLLRTTVKPEHFEDYRAALKANILPAAQKAGLKTFVVSQTRYGDSRYQVTSVVGLNKFADLDGTSPIVKAMGDSAYQSYLAKVRPMIVDSVYELYTFQKDLSYLPEGNAASPSGR